MALASHNTNALSPLYFLHIAKTAGSSFWRFLEGQFPSQQICTPHLWSELLRLPRESLGKYQLFRGHFHRALEAYLQQPLRHITFLRDPIERSISHYAHVHRSPYHPHYERTLKLGSFKAFLQDPITRGMISNYQTRMLALSFDPRPVAAGLTDSSLAAYRLEQILEAVLIPEIPPTMLLDLAREMLDRCLCVGITERFDDSLRCFSHKFAWDLPAAELRLNCSSGRLDAAELDQETLDDLIECTALDHQLYRYGQQRLEQQLASVVSCARPAAHAA